MSQAQEKIQWGDIIRLHGVSTVPGKEDKGLIISKGFTDPNIYYQTYSNYDEVNFYRESLFQIIPKSNFDLHDQLLFDQKVKQQEKANLRERAKEQITQLYSNLKSKHQDKQHPEVVNVTYGAEVVFKHIESGEYLSGIYKAADIGEGAFKLELAKELSSQLIFRLVSHRSYEHQGNDIYYDDCLRIHHPKTDCYMNFPDTEVSIIFDRAYDVASFDPEDKGYGFYQNRPSIKKPVGRRINVINENKSKCLWKFIQHCRYEDSMKKDKIKSHDIVYFQHTKEKGLIASTLAQQQYYLKERRSSSEEVVSYECFWELIPKEGNQSGPEKCNLFWARNIVTGQILTYNGYKVQIKSKEEIEDGGFKSQGLVNLICGFSEDVEEGQDPVPLLLERGSVIRNDENVIAVIKYFDEAVIKMDFRAVEKLTEDSFIIVRVSEETIRDVSYILSSQQAFVKVVEILSTELKKRQRNPESRWIDFFMSIDDDLLFSFVSVLKLLAGKIYDTDYESIQTSGNSPIIEIQKILVQTGIAQLLMQIIFTLYEPFYEIETNDEITDDRPKRMKVAEIFELSYILVRNIVKDFQDNKIYFSRWTDLFIEHSNKINKAFIEESLIAILKNNPVSIKEMINADTINNQIASFFQEASSMIADMPTKHLRLFSTFIRGENIVMKENQKHIFEHFFFNQHNEFNIEGIDYTFKFKVEYRTSEFEQIPEESNNKDRSKVVKVSFGREDPCTLNEFYESKKDKFNYLLSYVSLLADVCMDRNNEAIQYVEHNLPLAVVSTILFDDDLKELNDKMKKENDAYRSCGKGKRFQITNICEPFIRIGHHAYVNNFKFSPILRIRKIVKWYKEEEDISEVEDITRTKRVYEGQKEQEEKTYLRYLLEYIKKFLEDQKQNGQRKDVSNLQILDTVLSFLKETILLGLWDSIQQFREIIPLLIKNMIQIQCDTFFEGYDDNAKKRYSNGKDWVDSRKETLRMNRPEIALAIECKNKATEIFKYMNEMEIDIRLRYLMNFFQGIYEATENVEVYSDPIEDEVKRQNLSNLQVEEYAMITTRNDIAKEQFYKIFGTNILGQVKKYSEDQDMLMKEYLWYNKIKTMIPLEYGEGVEDPDKDRDLFKNSQEDFPINKVVLSLFELSGYMNKNLLNNSLSMLRAMFEQRSDIIESYKNLLICGKGNLSEVYLNLKFMRNKFAMLKNDIILSYDGNANKSFSYAIFKPYDHLGREEDKRSGIIQDLFFLARTLKDNVSLKNIESLMNVQKECFDKSIVYHFYTQKEKNNDLFQQLNMAEGIYDPLIEYIKIIGKQQLPEIHRWLLFSIYQYLTLLCFNNMKAKHMFMKYIPNILPHLNKRVGAASFLYEVCINNKILVNNEELVNTIIDGALNSCLELEKEELVHGIVSNVINQDLRLNNNFEKSRILYSLRGILIFNDEGHKRNQQILLNKLSDNKFRRLVFKDFLRYKGKREDFNLSHAETYATTHFQLFSAMVESQNLINIGKLQNLHPYLYCLSCMKETSRWQLRRALRSYVNRLYYVHKDKDIFMFEEFIRKEFTIINKQLFDLVELHRKRMLTEELKVKNGIRFCYAESEIILLILEILITLHEMFLKKRFRELLLRELGKEEKLDENNKKLHKTLTKLLKYLGCINKLYSNTKVITSFIKEIKQLMKRHIFVVFPVRYLERMSVPNEKDVQEQEDEENKGDDDGEEKKQKKIDGEEGEKPKQETAKDEKAEAKKSFTFDRSKTFFRNLINMMKSVKQQENYIGIQKEFLKSKNQMDVSEDDLKARYIQSIFMVPHQNSLRSIAPIKVKQEDQIHYVQHLQTAHSKMFKLLAKPEYEENQENLELNSRLNNVKEMLADSPAFKKLKQDQFYKLVRIFTSMDELSAENAGSEWQKIGQDPRPVFSKREIIKNCFELIINYPDIIRDSEKIFIIKLVRCYIAEAVEEKQNHKLSVDKWSADYYTDETSGANLLDEEKSELVRRQHQIEQCGGSRLLLSIFKENLFSKTELLNEALLLGIIYLYNGNTHCQNSILNELKKDPTNAAFMNMRLLIKNIGNFLIQVRKFKDNEKERDFSYKIVDSYDLFDEKQGMLVKMFGHKTDKFQIQTELNYELALCRTFRFLQLFCENNNIEMKKFLMTQTNEDGLQKITTINFIQQACQLLRQFFKIMSSKVVNIPPSILDFINQITQIPCLVCQKSLMRSTFFEDMSYMGSFFEDKINIQQRKFNFFIDPESDLESDPLNTLQNIYGKGIGLALSNFEGNDNQIFWEFLNKCQPLYLWIVIRQNMIKLLRPMAASRFKVIREDVEKMIEDQIHREGLDPKQKEHLLQFREYYTQYEFIRAIFERFGDREIIRFISEQRAAGPEFGEEICNIINVLAILKKIDDYAVQREKDAVKDPEVINIQENEKALKARNFREELKEKALADGYPHIKSFIALFEDLILSIQISSDNGEIVSFQNLYFPKHPVFSYLAPDTRDSIMFEVGRDTRRDKLITLQEHYQQLKQQIQWCYQLKYYSTKFLGFNVSMSITSDYIDEIRKVARYISYGICALMIWLIIVQHDTTEKQSYFTFFHYNQKLIMRVITTIQLCLTLLFFGLWIKMRLNLCLSKLRKQQQEEGGGEAEEGGQEEEEAAEQGQQKPPPEGIIQKIIFYAIYISQYFFKVMRTFKKVGMKLKKTFYDDMMSLFGFRHISIAIHFLIDPIFNFIKSIGVGFWALLQFESGFLSILIFVTASIMGNFVGIEWYVIHLFDYFVGISLLTNVFKAVINNIGELTLLSTFAACFILVFNILSLNTYTSVIYEDDIPPESCEKILDCVLQVYTSGAIGDDMDRIYPGRFSFDMVYFIFMEILFSNLVSGIMIDGFGSLKEADAERDEDKYNKCYICSLEKPDMEKQNQTFNKHISRHFLWNYLFYRYVIELKDPSDFTGLEYSISTQIQEGKIEWFPDNGPKDEGGAIEELIGSLKDKMHQLGENLNSLVIKQNKDISNNKSLTMIRIENFKKKLQQVGMDEPAPLEL